MAITQYAFDPTGVNTSNRVVNEIQAVSVAGTRIIALQGGPFYTAGLMVSKGDGTPLINNVHYKPIYLYTEPTMATGIEVCAAIAILQDDLQGNLHFTYQVVGGEYSNLDSAIVQAVQDLGITDFSMSWEDILNKPSLYPPMEHRHDASDLVGMTAINDSILEIKQAIVDSSLLTRNQMILNSGHTKFITQNGDFFVAAFTGQLQLTFGRSTTQNGQFSFEVKILTDEGTSKYIITATEIPGDMTKVTYLADVITATLHPMVLFTDGTDNLFILGAPNTVWTNAYIVVKEITVKAPDPQEYLYVWDWSTTTVANPPSTVVPNTPGGNLKVELDAVAADLVTLTAALDAHKLDTDNPHDVNKTDVSLDALENYAASLDYTDDEIDLYATARSVNSLAVDLTAQSDAILQTTTDLTNQLASTYDRGVTF